MAGKKHHEVSGVRDVISNILLLDRDNLHASDDLRGDLHADSLDMTELAMELESEFRIKVGVTELDALRTVLDVEEFVKQNGGKG